MSGIKIINTINEIKLNNNWVIAKKFNSKDRLVDEKGNRVSSSYKGRRYRITEKRERTFSSLERFVRGVLGAMAVVSTLFTALLSKRVINLFTKSKENIRFAVLESSIPAISQTFSPSKALTPSEFLIWLKEDTARLGNEENRKELISMIKNEEVTKEEIRIFYAGLSESIVLDILSSTQTANSFNAVEKKIIEKALILETNFIQALNRKYPHSNLELRNKIEQRTLGASIFRHSMEEKEIQQIGVEFFKDLRKSGRLLTKQEFLDQNHPKGSYWDKGDDLGRILGANYIERVAQELGLKHIKVPKKIAVAKEGVTSLNVNVSPLNLELSTKQITIFAENITPLGRGTTREEVTEFLKILEATGFGDFLGDNFMLGRNQQGEEGIYFVDTEYMNFRHIPFLENNVAQSVASMVQKKDLDWINGPDGIRSYYHANQQRINRYLELYDIEETELLGNLLKTYVPRGERRKEAVTFTYNILDK